MNKKAIIVFQKNKELGKVKTRLAAGVGDFDALRYYEKMILHTHSILQGTDADVHVFYSSFIEENDPENTFSFHVQEGDDLGIRMFNAFNKIKDLGYSQVVIIGTDCLELSSKIIQNAFEILTQKDLVIGPATDGGYYLLGLNEVISSLFLGKTWSTSDVLKEALESILKENKTVGILETLNDIDYLEDLKTYESKYGKVLIS